LSQHEHVFTPSVKEPNFFGTDLNWFSPTLSEYISLFEDAAPSHRLVGEGTVLYLYSQNAIPGILRFNSNAKIIVMVRNPVDASYALHAQQLFSHYDDVESFEQAWRLQEVRMRGESMPHQCPEPKVLQYRAIYLMGEQIRRAMTHVPPDQFKVIVFDDFVNETRKVYAEVLGFLGLDDDGRTDFPRVNESKGYRSRWVANFFRSRMKFEADRAAKKVKHFLGVKSLGISSRIRAANSLVTSRSPLSIEFRNELADEFREDVWLLSEILKRDLSHWVAPERE